MARETHVVMICDMTGKEDPDGNLGVKEHSVTIDGFVYVADVSNAAWETVLNGSGLKRFLEAASAHNNVRRASTVTRQAASNGRGPAKTDKEQNRAIREWAARAGIDVPSRGRISKGIVERYHAEAGKGPQPLFVTPEAATPEKLAEVVKLPAQNAVAARKTTHARVTKQTGGTAVSGDAGPVKKATPRKRTTAKQ